MDAISTLVDLFEDIGGRLKAVSGGIPRLFQLAALLNLGLTIIDALYAYSLGSTWYAATVYCLIRPCDPRGPVMLQAENPLEAMNFRPH
jgi:hypothetical protein